MLELRKVNKSFYGNKVLIDLNLTVNKDDFITIIGSNGAGKTTLFNIISGKYTVDSGEIILNSQNITNLKPHKRAKVIHRIFQDPLLGSSKSLTILENLAIVEAKTTGFGLDCTVKKKNIEKYVDLLEMVNLGLDKHLHTPVGLLSGGQKQALSLLMAILAKPQILLLDEQTAALDPETAQVILKITEDLVKQEQLPTLMVTHNLSDACRLGNRLIMLDKGRIVIDIKDEEKANLTPEYLLSLFKKQKVDISDETLFS